MAQVKLGVIGCGVMGNVHLRAAQDCPDVRVVAVADLIEDRAREAAGKFSVPTIYTDGDALLGDADVEAVALALPACGRTALALEAFKNGKHVLTEKPVAMNAGEVRQLIDARGNLVAGCCSSRYRFPASAQATADFIATGALGDLRVLHARQLASVRPKPDKMPPEWRLKRALNGGGFLMNWGCYDLDYFLGLTGWSLRPRLVLAQTWPLAPQFASYIPPDSDAETQFAALIRCEGGTVITFERAEYAVVQPEAAWQIVGAKGSLRLTMLARDEKKLYHDYATPEDGVLAETIWEGDDDRTAIGAGLIADFAAAIIERRAPKTSLEQALIVQKITDAVYASARQGRAVEID